MSNYFFSVGFLSPYCIFTLYRPTMFAASCCRTCGSCLFPYWRALNYHCGFYPHCHRPQPMLKEKNLFKLAPKTYMEFKLVFLFLFYPNSPKILYITYISAFVLKRFATKMAVWPTFNPIKKSKHALPHST